MGGRSFAQVLDEAIVARGLSMERVVARLGRSGTPCSVATLSLWRRGRVHPTMARSGRVLTALEQVLGLEAGTFAEALRHTPEPSDPEWWSAPTPVARLTSRQQAIESYLVSTGVRADHDLERVHVRMTIHVDEARVPHRVDFAQVIRTRREGFSVLPVIYWNDYLSPTGELCVYQFDEVFGATLTHTMEFPELGATAGLLQLDEHRPVGGLTAVEASLVRLTDAAPLQGWDYEELQSRWPVGRLTVEARFDGAPPRKVLARSAATLPEDRQLVDLPATELRPGIAQVHEVTVSGGGVRLEWTWDETDD